MINTSSGLALDLSMSESLLNRVKEVSRSIPNASEHCDDNVSKTESNPTLVESQSKQGSSADILLHWYLEKLFSTFNRYPLWDLWVSSLSFLCFSLSRSPDIDLLKNNKENKYTLEHKHYQLLLYNNNKFSNLIFASYNDFDSIERLRSLVVIQELSNFIPINS